MPQGLCWLGGPGFSLRGTAFSAIAAGIPGSRHFRAGKRAQHEDREDGSLPLHSQSYLFGFHSVRGGLSVWWNNLWLLVMLVPALGFIRLVVIPREERFLECNFPEQYLSYKSSVRRWL